MHNNEEEKGQLCFGNETSGKIKEYTEEANDTGDGEMKGCGLNNGTDFQWNDYYREQYPWRFKMTQ